jgi:hypothetical protein
MQNEARAGVEESPLMDDIERIAGPQARADIENSAAAERSTGSPRERPCI